jgi:hypothetical protein
VRQWRAKLDDEDEGITAVALLGLKLVITIAAIEMAIAILGPQLVMTQARPMSVLLPFLASSLSSPSPPCTHC